MYFCIFSKLYIYIYIYLDAHHNIYTYIYIYTHPGPISTRQWEAFCPMQSFHLSNLSGPVMGLIIPFCEFSVVGCLKALCTNPADGLLKPNGIL